MAEVYRSPSAQRSATCRRPRVLALKVTQQFDGVYGATDRKASVICIIISRTFCSRMVTANLPSHVTLVRTSL